MTCYVCDTKGFALLTQHLHDDEISTSPRGLGILYKTLLARRLSKSADARYRPKHVVFPLLISTII